MRHVVLIVAAVTALSSCGYGLAGRNVSLPDHIKVIAVPMLTNRTAVPDLDQMLTQAILKELQSRGRFRVVPDAKGADVDAVVSGSVSNLTLTPKTFNQGQATRVDIAVMASIELKDLRNSNKVLWSNPGVTASDEFPIGAGTGTAPVDAAAYLRQNNDAYQRLAAKFARTVVTSMLEGM